MSKQRQRGNEAERAIAKRLGGQRVGHLGGEDVALPWLSLEVKEREKFPVWLIDAMGQAWGHAKAGQLPAVVLHTLGTRHDNDMVVMRLADFEEWFGGDHARTTDGLAL
jgi:hypothetical protein